MTSDESHSLRKWPRNHVCVMLLTLQIAHWVRFIQTQTVSEFQLTLLQSDEWVSEKPIHCYGLTSNMCTKTSPPQSQIIPVAMTSSREFEQITIIHSQLDCCTDVNTFSPYWFTFLSLAFFKIWSLKWMNDVFFFKNYLYFIVLPTDLVIDDGGNVYF